MHSYLSQAIYEKYYLEAQCRGIIWTRYSYAEKHINRDDYDSDLDHTLAVERYAESAPHMDAIETVLAYEISIFVYRRLNGPWGEMVDFFSRQRNVFINEYAEKTGYRITDTNKMEILY